jgi:hypothetical protein
MTKAKGDVTVRSITINPNPKGEFKLIGGSLADDWNMRLLNGVGGALPVKQSDVDASTEAITAIGQTMIDMKPDDPIEGMLIAQLMAANEAALTLYRNAMQRRLVRRQLFR